jgi:hypothetical protein
MLLPAVVWESLAVGGSAERVVTTWYKYSTWYKYLVQGTVIVVESRVDVYIDIHCSIQVDSN